jgi:hypothetical protein
MTFGRALLEPPLLEPPLLFGANVDWAEDAGEPAGSLGRQAVSTGANMAKSIASASQS